MHLAAVLPAFALATELLNPFSFTKRELNVRDTTGGYAPTTVTCPRGVAVRQGPELDLGEEAYIAGKTVTSLSHWTSYLDNVALDGLDVSRFVPSAGKAIPGQTVPVVSVVVSGGGQRAMLIGAGMMAAMDNRNASAVAAKTGGILQITQYLAGLSGASFLTGSSALASFPPFEDLRDNVWKMENSFYAPVLTNPFSLAQVAKNIANKAMSFAPISVVDIYGRFLMYNLISDSNPEGPGAAATWSSIRNTPGFKNHTSLFPIILSAGRAKGDIAIDLDSPLYESTPFTFSTNLPSSGGLSVPMEYLGTHFDKGVPSSTACIKGFDSAGLLMACSGTAFGIPAQMVAQNVGMRTVLDNPFVHAVLGMIPDAEVLAGRIVNPFKHMAELSGYPAAQDEELKLVDAGFTGEAHPCMPRMKPSRKMDVVVVVDSSDEPNNNYPDGTSIHSSYLRSIRPGYPRNFPFIPPVASFTAQGLHKRPGFFGSRCYPQPNNIETPTFTYLPNYFVNFKTDTFSPIPLYSKQDQMGFFNNMFGIVTQSHVPDTTWPTCMACALVDVQQERNGIARTSQCEACFSQYCYMGKE